MISPPLHGRELQPHNMQLDAHDAHGSGRLANLIAVRNTRDKRREASRRMGASGRGIEKPNKRTPWVWNNFNVIVVAVVIVVVVVVGVAAT